MASLSLGGEEAGPRGNSNQHLHEVVLSDAVIFRKAEVGVSLAVRHNF